MRRRASWIIRGRWIRFRRLTSSKSERPSTAGHDELAVEDQIIGQLFERATISGNDSAIDRPDRDRS
jgi:hypothetical protein